MIKSASAKAAPISVPPSISKVANPTLLLDAVIVLFVSVSVVALPTKVSVALGKVSKPIKKNFSRLATFKVDLDF